MIEIEIEMDSDVANAELKLVAEGIDEEISRIEGARQAFHLPSSACRNPVSVVLTGVTTFVTQMWKP